MRETRIEVSILKEIKIMIDKSQYEKRSILICHPNLLKRSLDIRPPINPEIGKEILIMNPFLRDQVNQVENRRNLPLVVRHNSNRSMNIIVWNCRGCNDPDFRRNFRSLLDWHKPLVVALLETKMQDHQPLLENVSFNKMIEVLVVGNSSGIVVLWDDNFLELDEIATIAQQVHAMIKVHYLVI